MGLLKKIKKHFAIKSYVKRLPRLLKKDYGKHKRYSAGQVRKSVERYGLNMDYIDYALASYISKQEYDLLIHQGEVFGNYNNFRQEVADTHFDCKSNYTIHDALEISQENSSFFGGGSDGFDDISYDGPGTVTD